MRDDQTATARLVYASVERFFSLPAGSVGPKTTAADVEAWDSVSHVGLILAVEEEFGIMFDVAALGDVQRLGDLAAECSRLAGPNYVPPVASPPPEPPKPAPVAAPAAPRGKAPRLAEGGAAAFAPFAAGLRYLSFMPLLAAAREPRSYFEIGTSRGRSLKLIDCASVCVDPSFRVEQDVIGKKPSLMAFQMTSDDFFERYRLSDLLPEPGTVDMAFLDGMHHFEFLLRDFMNTEKYCDRSSVVMLHDCLPLHPLSALRRGTKRAIATDSRRPVALEGSGWTGDVWKVLRILLENRPDLRINVFDCSPSSLVVITGCDRASTVLHERYDALVAKWMDADLQPGWFDALHDSVKLVSSRENSTPARLRAVLGL